jgi:unspecific monooxygenase
MFRRRWTRFMGNLIAERRAMTSQSGSGDAAPRDLFDLMVAARDPETGELSPTNSLAIRFRP